MRDFKKISSRSFWRIPEDQCFDTVEERDEFFLKNPSRLNPTDPSYCPICKVGMIQYDWYKVNELSFEWKETYLNWQGPPGNPGKDGLSSIRVGSVKTLNWDENAYILPEGTEDDIVLNFYIPRGRPGGLTASNIDIISSDGTVSVNKRCKPGAERDNVIFDVKTDVAIFDLVNGKLDKQFAEGMDEYSVPNSRYAKDISINAEVDTQVPPELFSVNTVYGDMLNSGTFDESTHFISSDNSIKLASSMSHENKSIVDLVVSGKINVADIPMNADGERLLLLDSSLVFDAVDGDVTYSGLYKRDAVLDVAAGGIIKYKYTDLNGLKESFKSWLESN